MSDDLYCSLISVLISRHCWNKPLPKQAILSFASYPSHQGGEAKKALERLRGEPFISDHGNRGIGLNNSEFNRLARFLYDACDWRKDKIKLRLKHYEGLEDLDLG